MESTISTSSVSVAASTRKAVSSKRLLFDRRYGWVFDEWKEPSEEALAGGRGMFCILPLAKALVNIASQSINLATNSAVKALERPDQFSPQALQANLNRQFQNFVSSFQQPNSNLFTKTKADSSILSSTSFEHISSEISDSQNG
ncbi:uncharacterized protein LOC113356610 [Papaver somniferum]|uniref:uncharacterized protein LOC113356610 n=1 Tax=Papaver somniferum TaxID=3469 RepID=UPI000E7004DD|nr:uncharacterized protein LOC113356610 [Papaver somniferum]